MIGGDTITIKDLVVFAKHGVLPEETILGQKFLVSLTLYCDLRRAGMSDELKYSLNYAEVSREAISFLTDNTFLLIESCAERLVHHLLLLYPGLKAVEVEIKKPWAPIGLDLDTVSVKITRAWHRAYIALGSNLGDKQGYLEQALRVLQNHPDCRLIKTAPFITTAPYGYTAQDSFINSVALVETLLSPHELLDLLHALENQARRKREIHWGPRTLDLDIIFYDDLILSDDDLIIPHPDMTNRAFVLEPMCAIAPYFVHPLAGKTMTQLLQELEK